MVMLFGQSFTKQELGRVFPDLLHVAGFKKLTMDDGAGRGTRLQQIDSGGGLRVDLLPDRCCDIGQVWCEISLSAGSILWGRRLRSQWMETTRCRA